MIKKGDTVYIYTGQGVYSKATVVADPARHPDPKELRKQVRVRFGPDAPAPFNVEGVEATVWEGDCKEKP